MVDPRLTYDMKCEYRERAKTFWPLFEPMSHLFSTSVPLWLIARLTPMWLCTSIISHHKYFPTVLHLWKCIFVQSLIGFRIVTYCTRRRNNCAFASKWLCTSIISHICSSHTWWPCGWWQWHQTVVGPHWQGTMLQPSHLLLQHHLVPHECAEGDCNNWSSCNRTCDYCQLQLPISRDSSWVLCKSPRVYTSPAKMPYSTSLISCALQAHT